MDITIILIMIVSLVLIVSSMVVNAWKPSNICAYGARTLVLQVQGQPWIQADLRSLLFAQ